MRSIAQINEKIQAQTATVLTVTELKARVRQVGIHQTAQEVDVITTGTFEPMESSGAILNLGQTDPPIKIRQCWLDQVPAYAGFGAVDLYIGASQMPDYPGAAEGGDHELSRERGGGHVIADLIAGRNVKLRAIGQGTDCYPRVTLETTISKATINQFYLFNPRNLYQNFIVGTNAGDRPLYTYLGMLQPHLGNAVYANPGALSPLLNDPELNVIGVGTRILLGGAPGYITWEGTQHFPLQKRLPNQTPIGPAATVALIGDAKQMDPKWVRGCYFKGYGASIMLGVAVPLAVLNERVVEQAAVEDTDLVAPIVDFSIPRRVRPTFGLVSYAQLKSGKLVIDGKVVRVAPLASLYRSQAMAQTLQQQIQAGTFLLSEAVAPLPNDRLFLPQDIRGGQAD
ncbi:homocysteine biosynthesis protein [filamentous cyanobacterium LEGE 11480]|uniref:Homocysteine biosynthesis protein n=2 Tax=Romeriopsis TaxID=2992131 RepID=A0A928Z4S6_9CYAN|nr:homocysteine biosynthesis protein [Romeriopsis navalis]MBE9030693.1 homocysteine biosynthesis protein [Romeriopsis navalis LEGE 11480]